MTIFAVYSQQPKFSSSDQNPLAQRFQVNQFWVDADAQPTQEDVDNFLNPPAAVAEAARISSYDTDASAANRKVFLTKLASLNATDLETFVRGYINADSVTNLTTAIAFAKRAENAIVVLTKMLVKSIKN